MNRYFSLIAAICAAVSSASTAEPKDQASAPTTASSQHIARASERVSTYGAVEYFTGRVRVDPLFSLNENINASGAYVTFEPGARSAWHIHPGGQRLVVTSGDGLTQEWGQPAQQIRSGDVVWCPPGVKHWHGATMNTAMTHLALSGTVNGKTVIWMEKVTDEQYKTR